MLLLANVSIISSTISNTTVATSHRPGDATLPLHDGLRSIWIRLQPGPPALSQLDAGWNRCFKYCKVCKKTVPVPM